MASIGTEIPDDKKPESQVGQAITQQQSQIPDDEISRSPAFAKTMKWLEKPENLMTALVFAGSVIQPKTGGRNALQTVAQRGLGTLAFRSELNDTQRKERNEQGEQARRQQIADAEIAHRKEQIGVAKDQVAATRENTQVDANTARMMAGMQAGVAGMNDATRRYLAELDRETALKIAGMEQSLKQAGLNQLFGPQDLEQAVELYGKSLDSDTPMPNLGAAIEQIMRPKILFAAIQNPQYAGLLNVFERDVGAPGPMPATSMPGRSNSMEGLGPVKVTAQPVLPPMKPQEPFQGAKQASGWLKSRKNETPEEARKRLNPQ